MKIENHEWGSVFFDSKLHTSHIKTGSFKCSYNRINRMDRIMHSAVSNGIGLWHKVYTSIANKYPVCIFIQSILLILSKKQAHSGVSLLNKKLASQRGFTLMEILVAMVILITCVSPLGLWFYKSNSNQAAYKKYYTVQVLKRNLHRAFLSKTTKRIKERLEQPWYLELTIDVIPNKNEFKYHGTVSDRQGRVISELYMTRYE